MRSGGRPSAEPGRGGPPASLSVPAGLQKALGGPPGTAFEVRFDGAPAGTPDAGGSLRHLAADGRTFLPGPATDAGPRRYRLTIEGFQLDFGAAGHIGLALWAMGEENRPPQRPGPWSKQPSVASASDPRPPVILLEREDVLLASMADARGEHHARLDWPAAAGAVGYFIYTTTESKLRADHGLPDPSPDLTLSQRLAELRQRLRINPDRRFFTRINDAPIAATSTEVTIPRGSKEIHLYLVLGVSAGQVESPWPDLGDPKREKRFIAYAAPQQVVPAPPVLEVRRVLDAGATPPFFKARVLIRIQPGAVVTRLDLHRVRVPEASLHLDMMGPPVASLTGPAPGWQIAATPADGPVRAQPLGRVEGHDAPSGSWKRVFYRAVAWSADDPERGILGGRSAPSAAQEVVIPPAGPPDLDPLAWSWPGGPLGDIEIATATGVPVAATPLAIVVVFVPVAFMDGEAGQWFKPFALTLACSVLVSLFVSFSLDPMLSAYWPDPHLEMKDRAWISRVLGRFNAWFDRQADGYKGLIGWALGPRWTTGGLALASFAGALAMPAVGLVGSGFFPDSDDSEFNLTIETPPGSNLAYTRIKTEEASRLARAIPEVAYTYATIGGRTGAVDEARVYVRLVPKAARERHQSAIEADLRQQLARLGGVTAGIGGNFEEQKQIQLQLQGPDSRELARLAELVLAEVRQVPGAVDVGLSTRGQKPELEVSVDRGLAGTLGISVGQVGQTLRVAFAGLDAGDWIDPAGETRDVYVRLAPEARASVKDVSSLPLSVAGPDGRVATVPLSQVATVQPALGPARIDHLDRERVVSVQANTEGRPLSEVMGAIQQRLAANLALPAGYTLRTGGESEDQAEVFAQIFAALGLAVLLMYFVLVVQFGSFVEPLAIMLSLPLSLIGVMLALATTGATLNIMSMIGVILLMGIVAKNAILLVDFAKTAEEAGTPRRAAIVEAGRVRLRPILMTTFALIAGMVPIAIGAGEGEGLRRGRVVRRRGGAGAIRGWGGVSRDT